MTSSKLPPFIAALLLAAGQSLFAALPLPRSFFGSESTSRVCHSATPMGFFTSRNAYSTFTRFFASLHSSSPMLGASSLCRIWSSTAER